MNRHESRQAVLELLFESALNTERTPEELFETSTDVREVEVNAYVKETFFGVFAHLLEIDAQINQCANAWRIDRMSGVSAAILRLATYEILYTELPAEIGINEAVELAKAYDTENAPAFVNGVLNRIARENGKIASDNK